MYVAKLLQQHRSASGSSAPGRANSFASRTTSRTLDRKTSTDSYGSYSAAEKKTFSPPQSHGVSAPPPYTAPAAGVATTSTVSKKAPPPPPPMKPKASYNNVKYATAIFDYEAQAEGDLSFHAGDRIEIVEQTESAEDWWTGRLDGVTGVFPGNYTQVE